MTGVTENDICQIKWIRNRIVIATPSTHCRKLSVIMVKGLTEVFKRKTFNATELQINVVAYNYFNLIEKSAIYSPEEEKI